MKKEQTQLNTKQLKQKNFKLAFSKLQRKETRGNFCDESETWKCRYITYELSSFILNLSIGELCQRQLENRKGKGKKLKIKIIVTRATES